MKKGKLIMCSVVGAIVCSALCIGYSNKSTNIATIKTEEYIDNFNFKEQDNQSMEINDYWESASVEEIKNSILGYIDDMMESTIIKLEDFKKENNLSKIKLYENEIKRLNTILDNVKSAETKEELRKAMQVRHKDSV
ncbi:peptidylprolyl isomerase [Candidatus Arthromitus sp. SFB-turkey]|uniref:peptidylprolyl isomerase n=1 Tax=Candidatus Arthromitus sp. SFB-turkey TaxID=1840217 RepID=UPI0007F4A91F|nr:peptidylprolyl isomerase [Candidatus Arthromitus sp. SFB-turkey]OAT88879.1 peptidylprolyl isomerase [Candidatus Arthromitus sp. SFB-turkey]HJC99803.1 peptidylprolyl isomerase [Candidatus Dwaynia gallinarum]